MVMVRHRAYGVSQVGGHRLARRTEADGRSPELPRRDQGRRIGGGGVNAVNRMIEAGLRGVEFIAVNTDAQTLLMSDAEVKLDIGRETTRGLGAGSIARRLGSPRRRSTPTRSRVAEGADMVFITGRRGLRRRHRRRAD